MIISITSHCKFATFIIFTGVNMPRKNIMLSKMIIMIMIQANNMQNFQPRGLNGICIVLKFGLLSKLPELYQLDYSKNMSFANSCICEY